jgi:hypothetical protein
MGMDENDLAHCILIYWGFGNLIRNVRRIVAKTTLSYYSMPQHALVSLVTRFWRGWKAAS